MPNRLALETSPYLLQHADNLVDWQAWEPEALAQARCEDKPILLSVRYSTCDWGLDSTPNFEDTEAGGFFFTSHDHEKLIHRTKPAHDNATPSGNGVAAVVLGRLGLLPGEPRYQTAAEPTLRLFQSAMIESPAPYPSLLTALAEYLAPPRLIVLRGPEPELSGWKRIADKSAGIHDLLFKLTSDAPDIPTNLHKPIKNTVNAYVCAGVNCLPEIVQIHDLTAIFSDLTVQ